MMTLLILLSITLLLPLVAFVLLQWIGPRLGEPLAAYVGTGAAMLTFGMAIVTMIAWIYGGSSWGFHTGPLVKTIGWLPIGTFAGQRNDGFLDLAFYVDSVAVALITMVAFVSAIVHLFSIAYMRGDSRYPQFFAYLSLFIFAMIGLLLSASLVQVLIAWELVDLCSYLLIGFWHEKAESRSAAIKAFVTNRVGDVGLIAGVGIIVAHVGNTTLPDLWLTLGDPTQQIMSPTMLTIVGVLLFGGAMAKSAQFPLHAWLSDAVAGPTPVCAMIHASTTVTAGVFLLARVFPILTPDARLFIVVIGSVSIAIGSLCALAERDLKKALALSTMAQLGYMVLAIGVGSWIGAMFHLLTHAFFKALLFLGAGTVVHAMGHETRLEKYGGLYRRLPVTAVTFAIGGLAMSGAPFLSGFYSRELILGHVSAWASLASESDRGALLQLALWVPVLGAYLTPLYMTRLWMLTFAGRTRDRSRLRRAGESGIMSFSLVALSGMTIVVGYAWFPIQSMVEESATEARAYTEMARIDPLNATWPTLASPAEIVFDATEGVEVRQNFRTPMETRVAEGMERAHRLTWLAWLLGVATGVLVYARGFEVTERLGRLPVIGPIRLWLRGGMFFDDLYGLLFVGSTMVLSGICTAIDRSLFDPIIHATAWIAGAPGGGVVVGAAQAGRVRVYIGAVVVALTLGAGALILILIQNG